MTPSSAAAKGNERGNEVWEVKIPSYGTVETGQAGLTKVHTVWMKIMDKERFGYMVMFRITTSGTFTKADTEVFHLETVIVYNFSPYFGHRVALTCFYNVRKEEVGSTKCS